eukprot:7317926-Prymnesium_polylepis.1
MASTVPVWPRLADGCSGAFLNSQMFERRPLGSGIDAWRPPFPSSHATASRHTVPPRQPQPPLPGRAHFTAAVGCAAADPDPGVFAVASRLLRLRRHRPWPRTMIRATIWPMICPTGPSTIFPPTAPRHRWTTHRTATGIRTGARTMRTTISPLMSAPPSAPSSAPCHRWSKRRTATRTQIVIRMRSWT